MNSDHDDLLALAARLSAQALGGHEIRTEPPGNSAEGASPVSETGYTGNMEPETRAATPSGAYPVTGHNRVQAGTQPGTAGSPDPLAEVPDLDDWPADCVDSARRFGHADALLYPLIGTQVRTPKGIGVLRQVLGGRAVVEFEGAQSLARFHVGEVRPLDMRLGGNQP